MAVTEWGEDGKGRMGSVAYNASSGKTVTTRKRHFWAKTNAKTDDDVTVLAYVSCPVVGDAHPNDADCYCIQRSATNRNDSYVWDIDCHYSDEFEIKTNPLLDPAKIQWNTEQFQTPVWRDRDGNAIINSAGDPFDPPAEKDDSRWTAVITKNVAAIPAWFFAFQDAVNSSSFTLDGKTIAAGEAKMSGINVSETQERNGVSYRVLTMTMHFRGEGDDAGSSGYGTGGGSDEFEPWELVMLDAGMRELSNVGSGSGGDAELRHIKNPGDGEPVSSPVPLDGAGEALDSPTPGTAVYLGFEVYFERDFNLLPLT